MLFKDAEAVIDLWTLSNHSATKSYALSLSALEGFYASQGLNANLPGSKFATDVRPNISGKPIFEGISQELQALLVDFERETWDFFELQGAFDHKRLLLECQVRAQSGEEGAARRLSVLNSLCNNDLGYRSDRPPNPPDAQVGQRHWALLIGNDNYPQSPLQGAVNDTLAWQSYLTNFLGVPNSHITIIHNATRSDMVTALYDLRDNPYIKEGDHILFAFSGHGSRFNAKSYSFGEDLSLRPEPIEAICPVDRGLPSGSGTPDISDRELLLILSDIHNRTKANITVVLDCCHLEGRPRGMGDGDLSGYDRRFRGMAPLVDQGVVERMFAEADNHPRRSPCDISVRSPVWSDDMIDIYRPAVLTACQDTQLAWEEDKRGSFTSAIMKVLRSGRAGGLTCSGLIEAISPLRRDQQPTFHGEDAKIFSIGT
ncbi:hypothetical protein MD484_g4578, partial [Candolleomyces efflorescens]